MMDEQNQGFLSLWLAHVAKAKIANTPVTTYLDYDAFVLKPIVVDGSKIVRETGFEYQYTDYTPESMREMLDEFKALNLWPAHLTY